MATLRRLLLTSLLPACGFAVAAVAGAALGDALDAREPRYLPPPAGEAMPLLRPLRGPEPSPEELANEPRLFGPAEVGVTRSLEAPSGDPKVIWVGGSSAGGQPPANATTASAAGPEMPETTGSTGESTESRAPAVPLPDVEVPDGPTVTEPPSIPAVPDDLPVLDQPMSFEDPCAGAEPGEAEGRNCPEGEPGSIGEGDEGDGAADGDFTVPPSPELEVRLAAHDGACPGVRDPGTDLFVDVFTSTPADVLVSYPTAARDGGLDGEVRAGPTVEEIDLWWDVLRRDGMPAWFFYCVRLVDTPTDGDVHVNVEGNDILGMTDSADAYFEVFAVRPRVVIQGRGQTTLHVEAPTPDPDHGYGVALSVVGRSADGNECRASEASHPRNSDGSVGDPEVRATQGFGGWQVGPRDYNQVYDHRALWDVDLEEGREYVACLWWYADRFGETDVYGREAYAVVVPDRLRLRISLRGVITVAGAVPEGSVQVRVDDCAEERRLSVPAVDMRGVDSWTLEEPATLCDNRGHEQAEQVTVGVRFERGDDVYETEMEIPTPTGRCLIDCTRNLYYFVPIPAYDQVNGVCADSFGDCEVPTETVRPGWVRLVAELNDGPRSGARDWVIGGSEIFAAGRAVEGGPRPWTRSSSARAAPVEGRTDALEMSFQTDEPVRARVFAENYTGTPCPEPGTAWQAMATSHAFRIDGLCARQSYAMTIELVDGEGVSTVYEWTADGSAMDLGADHVREMYLAASTHGHRIVVHARVRLESNAREHLRFSGSWHVGASEWSAVWPEACYDLPADSPATTVAADDVGEVGDHVTFDFDLNQIWDDGCDHAGEVGRGARALEYDAALGDSVDTEQLLAASRDDPMVLRFDDPEEFDYEVEGVGPGESFAVEVELWADRAPDGG